MQKILAILVYIGEAGIYLAPIIYIIILILKKKVDGSKKIT